MPANNLLIFEFEGFDEDEIVAIDIARITKLTEIFGDIMRVATDGKHPFYFELVEAQQGSLRLAFRVISDFAKRNRQAIAEWSAPLALAVSCLQLAGVGVTTGPTAKEPMPSNFYPPDKWQRVEELCRDFEVQVADAEAGALIICAPDAPSIRIDRPRPEQSWTGEIREFRVDSPESARRLVQIADRLEQVREGVIWPQGTSRVILFFNPDVDDQEADHLVAELRKPRAWWEETFGREDI